MKKVLTFLLIVLSITTGCDLWNSGPDDRSPDTESGAGGYTSILKLATYETGSGFDESGTEIICFDPVTHRAFSTNGYTKRIDIIDLSDPGHPALFSSINPALDQNDAKAANSVAFKNGILAAAVENENHGANGWVMFYQADGTFIKTVEVGVLPDMVIFTPDGRKVLVACEAEPYVTGTDTIVDPAGSVGIIDISGGIANATTISVGFTGQTADEAAFLRTALADYQLAPEVSVDFEPEYIAVSSDSSKAYVSLQENNGIAVITLGEVPALEAIYGLGAKDHSLPGNGIDAKDDGQGLVEQVPVKSLYMPDTLVIASIGGKDYLFSANEGDDREIENNAGTETLYADLEKLNDETPIAPSNTIDVDAHEKLRFLVDMGKNSSGEYEQIYIPGTRSFSIWNPGNLNQIYDSGDDFEKKMISINPGYFNIADDELSIDARSLKKGIEPEALEVASIAGKTYAFIGFEKQSGFIIYDVTTPSTPVFKEYITDRNLNAAVNEDNEYDDVSFANTGDLAPECIYFIPEADSPNGKNLLLVSNEVSGTLTIYQVNE